MFWCEDRVKLLISKTRRRIHLSRWRAQQLVGCPKFCLQLMVLIDARKNIRTENERRRGAKKWRLIKTPPIVLIHSILSGRPLSALYNYRCRMIDSLTIVDTLSSYFFSWFYTFFLVLLAASNKSINARNFIYKRSHRNVKLFAHNKTSARRVLICF